MLILLPSRTVELMLNVVFVRVAGSPDLSVEVFEELVVLPDELVTELIEGTNSFFGSADFSWKIRTCVSSRFFCFQSTLKVYQICKTYK